MLRLHSQTSRSYPGRPARFASPLGVAPVMATCRGTGQELPGYGPVISVNRPVRTRMPGGVGIGGEKPTATRFDIFLPSQTQEAFGDMTPMLEMRGT